MTAEGERAIPALQPCIIVFAKLADRDVHWYGSHVEIHGPSRLLQHETDKNQSSARVWLETESPVTITSGSNEEYIE